jgi:uncharacterized protein (TIGR03437 family)
VRAQLSFILWIAILVTGDVRAENLQGGVGFFQGLTGLEVRAMITDSDGSVVVAGTATSAGLPVTSNAFQPGYRANTCGIGPGPGNGTPIACADIYLARFDSHGTVLFGSYLGGSGADTLVSAALDSSGAIYLLGVNGSSDFPLPQTAQGAFLFQVKRDGTAGFMRTLGLSADVSLAKMVVANNSVYLAGTAFAGSLVTTPGAFQPQAAATGQRDAFVMRFDLSSGNLVYSSWLGGSKDETLGGLTVDSFGNAYVTGSTQSEDFPLTAGAFHQVAAATPLQSIVFVSVVDPTGTRLVASSAFGGESTDTPAQIALASNGDVLVAGTTSSHFFPIAAGSLRTPNLSTTWSFLVRLRPDLTSQALSIYLDRDTSIGALLPQPDGTFVLAGTTGSRTFPVTPTALERCHGALALTAGTGFLMHFNESGRTVLYSTYFNVSRNGSGLLAASIGPDGKVFLVEQSTGYDLSYYGGTIQAAGPTDGPADFLLELDPTTAPSAPHSCAVDAAGFGSALSSSGELITLFGAGIGPAVAQQGQAGADGKFPSSLDGTTVLVGGQPAELLYAASDQINAWMPPLNPGDNNVTIQVMQDGKVVATIDAATFGDAADLFGNYSSGQAAAINEDGSLNAQNHPASAGSRLTLFGTGFGATTPAQDGIEVADRSRPLALTPGFVVNSVQARVQFAGQAPGGAPGLIQIDLTVPSVPASGSYPIDFSLGPNFQLGNLRVWINP